MLCFRCRRSALPSEDAPRTKVDLSATALQTGRPKRAVALSVNYRFNSPDLDLRSMLSCDYCSLSWHLDCLDPPLTTMPPMTRKWMCPNHFQQTIVSAFLTTVSLDSTRKEKPSSAEEWST